MRTVFTRAGLALGLLLAATVAWAADPPPPPAPVDQGPDVHRMVIYNGAHRTVHYIYSGLSESDAASLRDLERAENEADLASELQQLKLQYVQDERVLEARRREVQYLLCGYNSTYATSLYTGAPYGFYGGYYGYGANLYPWYGWGGDVAAFGAYNGSTSNTLAVGVGDEGVVKTDLAQTLAAQANPDYAARANQDLSAALARASQSDVIRPVLGIADKGPLKPLAGEVPVTSVGAKVTVTTMDNAKIEGTVVREGRDWIVVDTKEGRRSIPKTQVKDVLQKTTPGVTPIP